MPTCQNWALEVQEQGCHERHLRKEEESAGWEGGLSLKETKTKTCSLFEQTKEKKEKSFPFLLFSLFSSLL